MNLYLNLFEGILLIIFLYLLTFILKNKQVLKEEHSAIFAIIVTDLLLPAMIFSSLSKHAIKIDQLYPAFLMLVLEITSILSAWLIGKLLKLDRYTLGAVIFCSAFGSSTFLGYPLILSMYPNSIQALSEAVLISEIGVGYPIFILGPILASYFGSTSYNSKNILKESTTFFKSPVFIALLLGILWGAMQLPTEGNILISSIFKTMETLGKALTPMAILAAALLFKTPKIKKIIIPLLIVIVLKLFIKPIFAGILSHSLSFPKLWQDITIILSAMPPAILGVVFLKRYGGNASLASALLLSATIVSSISVIFVFYFTG